MKKLLVLDANSIFNRAFYGVRPLSTSQGLPTNAVFGYINILKKHLEAHKPDCAVAAFDVHAPTFRHKMDADYKATRKPMPEDLAAQLPFLKRATEAMGLAIVEKEGFEADDILGTLSLRGERDGFQVTLVTGDRDSYQLVSEKTTLILAGTHKDETVTPQWIEEKFALKPLQMIDVKALAGDSSDNISGVKGIGEKTALKLIGEKKDLDGVYADPDSLPIGPSAREKIKAGKEAAYRSRALAEICRTAPLEETWEELRYEGAREELLRPLLVELEFSKMLQSFFPEAPALLPAEEAPQEELQGSLFDEIPQEEETVPSLDAAELTLLSPLIFPLGGEFYARWKDSAVRLTGDLPSLFGRIRPILFSAKEYYHAVFALCGHLEGVEAGFDLSLAAYLLNPQNGGISLSRLSLLFLKENAPFNTDSNPRTALERMEKLYPVMKRELEESSAARLYEEIELPLARVLAKMEQRGFRVSRDGLCRYGEKILQAAELLKQEIFSLAGEEFLIHSPKQLGRILFEKLLLPAGKKTKTGYATDAETLGKLRHLSPIVDFVLQYRTLTKLHSTYVEGMLKVLGDDERIHTVFHQTVTATGRLSSAEPNLQNIPVRTELGREMRRFFEAEEGSVLVDADYSQIELRLLAHMSGDDTLQRYFLEGKDIHTKTASEIFHVPLEEVTGDMRKSAKAVNFGIVYGIGEYSLSQDLGIPMRMAKDYIEAYFALFPKVRTYLDGLKEAARETGYAETLFGRRRPIPELKSPKKNLISFGERVAMNTPLQGTAADIIKLAMVRVDRRLEEEGFRADLVLQVHDELILECPEEEKEAVARLLSEEMEGAVRYSVPLIAEAQWGKTWFDCK